MSRIRQRAFRPVAAVLALVLVLAGCLSPETATRGHEAGRDARMPKRVTMVIPYDVGGGTDVWARFMAPYLQQHLDSHPSFLPENIPGGESITGSNQFVERGGTDGERVLITSGTTYFQALLGREEVRFDFTKLVPLILNGTGGVIYVSSDSGVKSVDDLRDPPKKLVYGGISATGLDLSVLVAFELLGLDVETTFGFEGRGPAALALQRGELNIDYQTTSAYHQQIEPLVKDGKARPLMSMGWLDEKGEVTRDPQLPKLPTVIEVYEKLTGKKPTGTAFEAYKAFLAAGFAYQKGVWVNPGTPDSITSEYYDSVERLRDDENFVKKGEAALGGYPIYSGREVGDSVRKAFDLDPSVRSYVLRMLETKYDTKVKTKQGP